ERIGEAARGQQLLERRGARELVERPQAGTIDIGPLLDLRLLLGNLLLECLLLLLHPLEIGLGLVELADGGEQLLIDAAQLSRAAIGHATQLLDLHLLALPPSGELLERLLSLRDTRLELGERICAGRGRLREHGEHAEEQYQRSTIAMHALACLRWSSRWSGGRRRPGGTSSVSNRWRRQRCQHIRPGR